MQYFDKRNRLTHNMIMEHFEVHKEQLEDLIIDLDKYGPAVFADIPEVNDQFNGFTWDEVALIDEMSGLNKFVEDILQSTTAPEL